jgi:ribosomal protein L7/L12
MIKIHRSKDKQFYVSYHGKNNQVLVCTKTLKTKQSALKNVRAMAGLFFVDSKDVVKIQDCTGKKVKEITL